MNNVDKTISYFLVIKSVSDSKWYKPLAQN